MPSPEKRVSDSPGPSRVSKRPRRQEQNNNTVNDGTSEPEENDGKCGILEWITVKNFMCHDHLHFEFSPHINFVQGRNGSGKSAILTAVVIGLGGRTRATNRGSSLKELVKHGKQVATIEIGIKNSGSNAFKFDCYGKSITVERKISANQAGYKLKSHDGVVVSTKKDELLRMMEHFNLQVDNPVTILNQDMSRSFFATTDPKMLFKLFLKATQLQQMKEDYNQLENTLKTSMKIIVSRRESLPELDKEVEEQRMSYQFSLSLREKGQKLKDLRHELAWAKIIENEKEKAAAEKAMEKHQKSITTIEENIQTLQNSFEQEKEMKERLENELQEASNYYVQATKDMKVMDNEMRRVKNEYKDHQAKFSIAEKKVRSISAEIATLKTAAEKDNNREQTQWAAKRAEWQKKVNETEDLAKEVIANLDTESNHVLNLQRSLEVKLSEKTNLEMEQKALQKQLDGFQRELKGLQNQKGSQVTVYGQWVPQLLKKIEASYSKGMFIKKPVGPMGAFIKVKDTKWAHVAERVLGNKISSFFVDNQADEKVLRRLMKELNFDYHYKPIVNVTKFRDKVHDVSRFEVCSDGYSSLWSVLDISNNIVANAVIDLMQVESILLIPTATEAGRLLKDRTLVPKNCKFAYTLNLDQYFPDPNYRLYSGKGVCRAKFLQVSVEDRIREIKRNEKDCEERENSLKQQIQESLSQIKTLREEIKVSDKKSQQLRKRLHDHRTAIAELQNQEASPPPDVAQLEDDIRQQEVCLENAKSVMEEIRISVEQSKGKFSDLSGRLLAAKQNEKVASKKVDECTKALSDRSTDTAMLKIERLRRKIGDLKKNERNLVHKVNEASQTLDGALKTAEAFNLGTRIETNRSVRELERLYTILQTRLNRERATSGDPVTIAERYMATKQRYKQVTEELNKSMSLIKKLRESLQMRAVKYWRLHKWLAVIVKYFFKEHVSLRKLDGSISINLDNQTLNIHVEKPGTKKGSPTKERSLKSQAHQELIMMSGGERSFATVAFIIALWHAIVSPVRILDEFDVFMDVIARNHAMKMMISAAKADTQYIFLTPLSLDTNRLNKCVFFKMPDPEKCDEESQDA